MSKFFTYHKVLLLCALFIVNHYCHAEITAMSNDELEAVTGTGFSASPTETGTINFAFDEQTKDGTPLSGNGTLDVQQKTETTDTNPTESANLSLNDSAQENLHALVNVNSVNSAIQVLLNLNVNINSVVDSLEQNNHAALNEL